MLLLLLGQTNLKFIFEENSTTIINNQKKLAISELSDFLYDLTLLYDCIVLATEPEYKNFRFSNNFWYRKGRPIKEHHKLYLEKINHNSPLGLEVIIPLTAGALGIPWLFIQAIEKVQNWKLNREKLRLEIEKLRLENTQKQISNETQLRSLDDLLFDRNAEKIFQGIIKRLEERKLIATDLEVNPTIRNNTNPE